jgi:predicted RNA binding protein YcfA (HicA-like mRNA interferase family)
LPKLRPSKPEKVKQVLEKCGFVCLRQSGSHAIYHHQDGRWTTVPMHKGKELGKGILRKILKDAKITPQEFENLL